MNKCELCKFTATTYCDSDEAHLCWTCDALVHGANFLVARHSRTLLCRICQSLTPWKASGPNLGRTLSFCDACASHRNFKHHQLQHHESEEAADNEDFTADGAQNQAVRCFSTSAPPASSSSSSSSSSCTSTSNGMKSLKRTRESSCSTDLKTPFQKNDINRSFSRRTCCRRRRNSKIRNSGGGDDGDAISSPLKKQKIEKTEKFR